jgi:hypothetical protein
MVRRLGDLPYPVRLDNRAARIGAAAAPQMCERATVASGFLPLGKSSSD